MAKKLKRLFPYDKNYILKEAQRESKSALLREMVESVKKAYLIRHNPLGLEDDPILKIKNCKKYDLNLFEEFYNHPYFE